MVCSDAVQSLYHRWYCWFLNSAAILTFHLLTIVRNERSHQNTA